jgi:putative transcriptional regulator
VSLWIVTLLRRILATTGKGRPFEALNARRLDTLGWVIVSTSVVTSLHQYLASRWILSTVQVRTLPVSHGMGRVTMSIHVQLDRVLLERGLSLTELGERVGIALPNLSILKTNKARAIRFSTLAAICRELDCQPGDLLEYRPGE